MGIKSTTKHLYSLIPYADITARQISQSVYGDKDRMPRAQRKSDLVEVKYTEANRESYLEYEQSETPLRLNDINFDNTYNSISLKSSDITITNDLGLEIGYVEITTAGGSYSAGTLTATGGGGSGFSGSYTVNSGAIDTVTIINRGQGYTSVPTIVISHSGDSAAVLTAHLLHPLNPLDLSFNNKENPCYTLALATAYLPLAGGALTGDITITDTTAPQLKLLYNGTNYAQFEIASTGSLEIETVGSGTTDSDITLNADGNITLNAAGGNVEFDECGVGFDRVSATFSASDVISGANDSTDIDFRAGNKYALTLTDNIAGGGENINFIFPQVSGNFLLVVTQDGTGSRTVNSAGWIAYRYDAIAGRNLLGADGTDGLVRWAGGSAPTLTTTANKSDIISIYWDADLETALATASLNF